MGVMAFVLPILPGRQEAWRRFCQELLESRRHEYEESRHRLGISKELAWLAQLPLGDMVMLYLEAAYPEQVLPVLASSGLPFDRWFRQQMLELYGVDPRQRVLAAGELIFDWRLA